MTYGIASSRTLIFHFCPSHGPHLLQFIMFVLRTLLAGLSYFQLVPARAPWCLGNFINRESESENEVKYLECSGIRAMIGENRQLVTDEAIEF